LARKSVLPRISSPQRRDIYNIKICPRVIGRLEVEIQEPDSVCAPVVAGVIRRSKRRAQPTLRMYKRGMPRGNAAI